MLAKFLWSSVCVLAAQVPVHDAARVSSLRVSVEIVGAQHSVSDPLLLRFHVASNTGPSAAVPTDNGVVRKCQVVVVFRDAAGAITRRTFTRSCAKVLGVTHARRSSDDLVAEILAMPYSNDAPPCPLLAGVYEVLVEVQWRDSLLVSRPVTIQLAARSDGFDGVADVSGDVITFVEQPHPMRMPAPREANFVLTAWPLSPLAHSIRERLLLGDVARLMELNRPATAPAGIPPDDVEAILAGRIRRFLDVAQHPSSGELHFRLLKLELELLGRSFGGHDVRSPIPAACAASFQAHAALAADAVRRLRSDCPGSSYLEDAAKVVASTVEGIDRDLAKAPSGPNVEMLRGVRAELESALQIAGT